jgi:hypothetical protein
MIMEVNAKMIILLQLVIYCLLYIGMVKVAARDSGRNCLYFYPKDYIEKAVELGVGDKEEILKKGKQFMILFSMVMFVALIMFISLWNCVTDFKMAFMQSCLFLVVMNWFDGIVIDWFWVGHSKIWVIPEMKGYPFLKSFRRILKRRSIYTILYLLVALIPACIIVLIGKL